MPVKRIFVAIDISEDVRRAAADHVSFMKKAFPDTPVKWEPSEKFHITMKFFGDTDDQAFERVANVVSRAAEVTSPFVLTMDHSGSFRRRDSAVLWIGVREAAGESGILARIANILENDSRQTRRFHPHITIARIKRPAQARELIDAHNKAFIEPIEFPVTHLNVYESRLLPTGSIYSVVSKHSLGE